MNMDKCLSSENIFVSLTFSINTFIYKIISFPTRILFQGIICRLLYQNCLFENNTNDLNKKIILELQQKIDHFNTFCKYKYNLFNKIQKVISLFFAFKSNI